MLLTVPISQSDRHLIPTVVKAFSLLSPGLGHDLLVVGLSRVRSEVEQLQAALAPYFRSSSNLILSETINLGWPREGNFLFQRTAYHVAAHYPPNESFLWFELDCTPLKPDWLTTLSSEYYRDSQRAAVEKRQPYKYMGVKMATLKVQNGELLPPSDAGYHMAACGVYPVNMAHEVKSLNAIPAAGVPFSDFIQWYVIPNLNDTLLIQDNWRTKNYQAQENVLFCEDVIDHAFGHHFNQPVCIDSVQVLVHGCKDGSLLNELQKAQNLTEIPIVPQATLNPAPQPAAAIIDTVPQKIALPQYGQSMQANQYAAPALPLVNAAMYRAPILIRQTDEEIYRMPDGEKPLNAYSVGNVHQGEPTPAPKIEPPRERPIEDRIVIPEVNYEKKQPESEPVLLNNKPIVTPRRKGRGPGRPRKIKREISPEERERRAEAMRAMLAKRWAKKNEVNG